LLRLAVLLVPHFRAPLRLAKGFGNRGQLRVGPQSGRVVRVVRGEMPLGAHGECRHARPILLVCPCAASAQRPAGPGGCLRVTKPPRTSAPVRLNPVTWALTLVERFIKRSTGEAGEGNARCMPEFPEVPPGRGRVARVKCLPRCVRGHFTSVKPLPTLVQE